MHRPSPPPPELQSPQPRRPAGAPRLRLVAAVDAPAFPRPRTSRGRDAAREPRSHRDEPRSIDPAAAPRVQPSVPLTGPADPRWVLAVRVGEQLEGEVLRPEKRQRLMKLARVLGLSPFDATLIIAIVQDQARRGYAPNYCPAAAEPQLTMVRLPGGENDAAAPRARRRRRVIMWCWIVAILAVEVVLLSSAL